MSPASADASGINPLPRTETRVGTRAILIKPLELMNTNLFFRLLISGTALTGALQAQVPDKVKHAIPAPSIGLQSGAQVGYSVATDGVITVAGAPNEIVAGGGEGAVKVFHSITGELLHDISSAPQNRKFGGSVAISGTRLVAGANVDNMTGSYHGSACVYDLGSATPTAPVAELQVPTPGYHISFDTPVAIFGTVVVVGVPYPLNSARAFVFDIASATPTLPVLTLNNPDTANPGRFGASVAISGSRVVVGSPWNKIGTVSAGSAFVFDIAGAAPTVPVAILDNPAAAADDYFGISVAISEARVVVGASLDDAGATDAGTAYVYDLAGALPGLPLVTLHNPAPGQTDYFGVAVAISGTRLTVGCALDDTVETNAGSVFVYDITGLTPTVPVATLNNPTPRANELFGGSVAISGGTQIVVGCRLDEAVQTGAGSAYVYQLAGPAPTQPSATLNHAGLSVGDDFGRSVAISGTRVAVGAPCYDYPYEHDAGIVFVYDLAGAAPANPVAELQNPNPGVTSDFGRSIAISGARVLIGDLAGAGAAHLYDLASATPVAPMASIPNPSPVDGDQFGAAVAMAGSVAVIGAPYDDTNATAAGSAYVYNLGVSPPVRTASITNPSPEAGDSFASSIALSGTLLVAGTPNDDSEAYGAGSAYVYNLAVSPPVRIVSLTKPNGSEGESFGESVAISGTRVAIGIPRDNTRASNAGSARVYNINVANRTATLVATLYDPNPSANAFFGLSLAISGTLVVVGSPFADRNAAGLAHVFDLASATPAVPVATLKKLNPGDLDHFGSAVAIEDSTAVIGIPEDDTLMPDKGAVHVFGPSARSLFNHAAATAGLAGPGAQPLAVPFSDGQANLNKYAFNMDLARPGVQTLVPGTGGAGLPSITLQTNGAAGTLRFEFVRRIDSGLIYTPLTGTDMASSDSWSPLGISPVVTAIDDRWERVIYTAPVNVDTTPANFRHRESNAAAVTGADPDSA
jgi:FG-GAP repeat